MKSNINPEYILETRKIYGSWIKLLREGKGWSQQELADRIGISRTTINKIEHGAWNFGIDTITILAVHLDFFVFFLEKGSEDDLAVNAAQGRLREMRAEAREETREVEGFDLAAARDIDARLRSSVGREFIMVLREPTQRRTGFARAGPDIGIVNLNHSGNS